jgi:hypothetical protein
MMSYSVSQSTPLWGEGRASSRGEIILVHIPCIILGLETGRAR